MCEKRKAQFDWMPSSKERSFSAMDSHSEFH